MARSSPRESDSRRRSCCFFKIFLPDQSSHRLRIPPAFRKHIEGQSPRVVSLKGPSGRLWRVDLVRDSNELFFQDGWKEFVADHSVVTGDFFVFRYDGSSCFTVLVFGSTACEKEGAFLARPCREDTDTDLEGFEEERGESVGEEEELKPPILPRSGRGPSKSKRKRGRGRGLDELIITIKESMKKNNTTHFEKDLEKQSQCPVSRGRLASKKSKSSPDSKKDFRDMSTSKITGNASLPSSSNKSTGISARQDIGTNNKVLKQLELQKCSVSSAGYGANNKKIKSEFPEGGVDKTSPPSSKTVALKPSSKVSHCLLSIKTNKMPQQVEAATPLRMGGLISQRRPVTEEEINRTLLMAMSFKSKNPSVIVVMRESYVYTSFFLNIPSPFVKEHLLKAGKLLTLWDPNGMPWKITLVTYDNRGAFSGGWARFSYANNLEKHDVCVFERIKRSHLRAHIFRVVNEITPLIRKRRRN